ncbi:LysR family transcriptional regulator [Colwellia sp. D2M02]|uniref:LysR substrate-binding domain-containing protein n=1 Tax=Colwellia asteriadis TaxID=517723 RepID=A0ABN1L660_9GAMM|nr:LysR family transcriptional regulator [Colwellia sp. D2M02]MBU2893833.1 LysR family transcriptional regulator [Colwellia sp. D2M02]
MDKLTYYKSYVAIIDKKSLKNAAHYLNLSPSAVSKHLSILEKYYGTDLVIRDAKNIKVTGEGKAFYHQCKSVLTSLAQAESVFSNDTRNTASILRITLPQILTQGRVMSMLAMFTKQYPQIKLDIITSNNNLDLIEQDIDFAFRGGFLSDSQVRSTKLFRACTILCAPASFTKNLAPADQLRMITDTLLIPSYVNLSTLRTYLQKIGIKKPLDQFTTINDAFSYKNAVLAGMGVGIFLDFFIKDELEEQSVWQITEPHHFQYRTLDFNMIFHKNIQLATSHELFKSFVVNYFNDYIN